MSPRPDYSVIVPFHSNQRLLQVCLSTLIATVAADAEVIVVVNNSQTADPPEGLTEGRIQVVRYQDKLGYPAAINAGARVARGRSLIFSDADTFYRDDWFARLTGFHRATPNIGLASSLLLDPGTRRVLDYGIAFTIHNAPHPQRDVRAEQLPDQPGRIVQAACSASMVIEADLFSRIGMFDETLQAGYADLDFCLRLNEAGRDCWAVNLATVFHRGGSSRLQGDLHKPEMKALFATKNAHRIRHDMRKYFDDSITAFRREHTIAPGYIVIDLLSVIDRTWHHDLLREHLEILSIYDYSFGVRDASTISLIDHLGINVLELRAPILYLVDRFVALQSNHLWLLMRGRNDDIIVDRNANIAVFAEVVHDRR